MKGWLVAVLLLFAVPASAAWLPEYFGTFPVTDDDRRDCTQPELPAPREGNLIRGIFQWSGPVAFTDTLTGVYGGGYLKPARWSLPGSYTVVITYADSLWNKSCPMTVTGIRTKKNPPGRGVFNTR